MALAFTTSIVAKEQLDRLSQAAAGTTGFVNTALSGAVTVSAPAAMTVDIAACAIGDTIHAGTTSTAATSAAADTAISASDLNNPRIDLVVLDSSFAFAVRTGAAAADPVPATLTAGDVELAQVAVSAGATQIDSGDITDRRQGIAHQTRTVKYKSATQAFTSNTTFADLTASSGNLEFTIGANETWEARWILPITVAAAASGGVKVQLTGPAAPTFVSYNTIWINGSVSGYDNEGGGGVTVAYDVRAMPATAFSTSVGTAVAYAANSGLGSVNGAGALTAVIEALIVNGANAGTVTIQGAQNSSDGDATTFIAGGYMIAERLS